MEFTFVFDGYFSDTTQPALFVFDGYLFTGTTPQLVHEIESRREDEGGRRIDDERGKRNDLYLILEAFVICQN